MAKKKLKLTTVCQDCLKDIPDKVIQRYLVTSSVQHYIMLCKNCLSKREKK
jgi:hypothetical protein